jgi:hypothetical protein
MSSQVVTPNTEAAILARVIESDATAITPDVARYLLSMQLPRSDQERVNELSAKARAGSLSEGETQELDSYLHIGRWPSCSRAPAACSRIRRPISADSESRAAPHHLAARRRALRVLPHAELCAAATLPDRSHRRRETRWPECGKQPGARLPALQSLQRPEHRRN